ncbi:hypothetical protein WUBG_10689, partial [Wuchereria bancrofti]
HCAPYHPTDALVDMRINQAAGSGARELVDSFEVFRLPADVNVWAQPVIYLQTFSTLPICTHFLTEYEIQSVVQ